MTVMADVTRVLGEVLALGERAKQLTADSALLGAMPEFDSMAVLGVITRLEEVFGISIADDEISAETFETVGSLAAFVEQKRG
ncbi:acyl carrier protein [Permianibacter sp. IMCC34836]|uniref:acyl carrier protein n=1 Tax=Permianibacter fluminis TaxID=2738515 RepID=UPI001552CC13|nr:phosphopantetheine-binding protein [Permianibacter fluminis]NQD35609.1 acyl carrier protein [Permianibacter fluminis]